jgi:Cof subfamily protein (haloacid dehalogenase superfamily)
MGHYSHTVRMVITDLDGTLHHPDTGISKLDLDALSRLGDQGIIRVIATGRNLFSFRRLIADDFPLDYLIFSSGAGIMEWKGKRMMCRTSLPLNEVEKVIHFLLGEKLDFMVHQAVPENHRFVYHGNLETNEDFRRRCELYRDFATPYQGVIPFPEVSQVLVIIPPDPVVYQTLCQRFPGVKVIRSTSPLNGHSIWLEVFHASVSKGHAASWLAARLRITPAETLACGNDYNDIELLEWAGKAYLLENAPEELKHRFSKAGHVRDSGFSGVIHRYFPGLIKTH